MLKKIVFVITGTIVIISVWFLTLDNTTQTNYQTLQLKNQTIQTSLKEKGIIVPQDAQIIIAKTNGLISNVLFEEGDTVKKNDVLMNFELKRRIRTSIVLFILLYICIFINLYVSFLALIIISILL